MIITSIVSGKNNRKRVHVDDVFMFALYPKEIKQYKLKEGQPITRELIDVVLSECVLRRGKLRAMNLLQARDYSRQELRRKLIQSECDEATITQVLLYLDEYHYLDDVRYARQFISFKRDKKSRRQIEQALLEKGISREDIGQAYLELAREYDLEQDEQKLLAQLIEKKLRCMKPLEDHVKWGKVYRYLAGKGFCASAIKGAMEQYHYHDDF